MIGSYENVYQVFYDGYVKILSDFTYINNKSTKSRMTHKVQH